MKEFVKRIKSTRVFNGLFQNTTTYLFFLLSGIFLGAHACKADDTDQRFTPGIYSGLALAVDRQGEIHGYFEQSLGGATTTCSFFLNGKDIGGKANITTWSRKQVPATLKAKGKDEIYLKIDQASEHPGCHDALTTEDVEGFVLSKTAESKWITLKIVKGDRASLFSAPVLVKKTKSYFIKDDVLAVLSMRGEWVNVEFPRPGKKSIKGWVRLDDLRDLVPPTDNDKQISEAHKKYSGR